MTTTLRDFIDAWLNAHPEHVEELSYDEGDDQNVDICAAVLTAVADDRQLLWDTVIMAVNCAIAGFVEDRDALPAPLVEAPA